MSERLTFNYRSASDVAPRPGGSPYEPLPTRGDDDGSGPASPEAPSPKREERRDLAFLGLMAFTAVLFFRPQDMIPILAPLHLAEVTALAALAALLGGRLRRGLPVTRFVPELAGVVALGAVILVTAPFSIWMGGAINTFTDLYVKVMLIFILMVNTLNSTRRVEQFMWVIVTALGYIAFRAVFDYARGVNLIENGRVQGAVGGIFKNPNDLALNLVAVMPLAASLALRPGRPVRRAFALACTLFMVAATVATGSRGGAVGLVLMGTIFGIRLIRQRPGLVFAGALALMMSIPALPHSYLERISSISNPSADDTGSREARRILLHEAYAAFLAHPLTGVGAGQFKNYNPEGRQEAWRETHNVVLQVAAELGVLGVVCFGFLVVRGLLAPIQTRRLLRRVDGRRRGRSPDQAVLSDNERESLDVHQVAMGASLVGWFVCALFASVAYHWTFYYLLAMAIAPREILLDRLKVAARSRHAVTRMVTVEARA
jgi:O-antigen ligase